MQLGYATTVHAAQGMTVDTAHAVLTGDEARQLLYVAVTRGRAANHLYLATPFDGDPHSLVRPEALLPPTAVETLTAVLARDGAQQLRTTTVGRLQTSPATLLHDAALRYNDALTLAAEQLLGGDRLAQLDAQLEALVPGCHRRSRHTPRCEGIWRFSRPMARSAPLRRRGGLDRELDSAEDAAAVLDWRLRSTHTDGPLPWLPAVPALLRGLRGLGLLSDCACDPGRFLAAQVRAEAASWTPARAPEWARHLTEPEHTTLRGDLAVWRAAFAVPDSDHRPTGPGQLAHPGSRTPAGPSTPARDATGHRERDASWQLPDEVTADPPCPPSPATHRPRHAPASTSSSSSTRPPPKPRPLPAEAPADALWWRIAAHLGPAALRATGSAAETLRPPWTAVLTAQLGEPDSAQGHGRPCLARPCRRRPRGTR